MTCSQVAQLQIFVLHSLHLCLHLLAKRELPDSVHNQVQPERC